MSTQNPTIGIDLGGTNVRLGLVHEGKIVQQCAEVVGDRRSPDAIVALLTTLILKADRAWGKADAVGIGAPGIVDPSSGIIHRSPHYPQWIGFSLRDRLQAAIGRPVAVDNDANAIAMGEATVGAGRDLQHFVMLTLGTGIGGGIIWNRQLLRGDRGFAAEVGHLVVDVNGPTCPCGGKGHWEVYASASGLHHLIEMSDDPRKEEFLEVTPADLYRLVQDGDIFAGNIWRRFGYYLGTGMATLVHVLGIEHFVIAGGVSAAWDFFLPEAQKALLRQTYKETGAAVQIHRAALGAAAGILGAASLV